VDPSLTIYQADLVRALKRLLKALKGSDRDKAAITFTDGKLSVAVAGVGMSVAAHGQWPGQALVPFESIQALSRIHEVDAALTLAVAGEMIVVSGLSLNADYPCAWSEVPVAEVRITTRASPAQVLAAAQVYSKEEMEAAGLAHALSEAQAKRAEAIERAYRCLSVLGVTHDELQAFVDAVIVARRPARPEHPAHHPVGPDPDS
jgi:hypothetical protein